MRPATAALLLLCSAGCSLVTSTDYRFADAGEAAADVAADLEAVVDRGQPVEAAAPEDIAARDTGITDTGITDLGGAIGSDIGGGGDVGGADIGGEVATDTRDAGVDAGAQDVGADAGTRDAGVDAQGPSACGNGCPAGMACCVATRTCYSPLCAACCRTTSGCTSDRDCTSGFCCRVTGRCSMEPSECSRACAPGNDHDPECCSGGACGDRALSCVGAQNVCKPRLAAGCCWQDSDCGQDQLCRNRRVCSCRQLCLLADQPGYCVDR